MKAVYAVALVAILLAAPTGAFLVVGPDVAGGRFDRVVDQAVDVLPVSRTRLPEDVRDGEDAVTLRWTYRAVPYEWTVGVDPDLARAFEERPRTLDPRTYGVYVTTAEEDPVVARLTAGLEAEADARGYEGLDRANFVLAFVQGGITYVEDRTSSGQADYPQFPAQTVLSARGDCEDAAVLYVALMRAMGLDATLLLLEGHMSAGVRDPAASGPRFGGYAFAEPSVPGYRVGEVPREFRGNPVTALEAAPQPALQLAWAVTPEEWGWLVRMDVWNNGTAPAHDVKLHAGPVTDAGAAPGTREHLERLAPGAHETRWVWVPRTDDPEPVIRAVAWGPDTEVVGADVPVDRPGPVRDSVAFDGTG